jgi:hypothetical protein
MRISMKAVLPKPINTRVFADEIYKAAEDMNKVIKADFEKTTETWDHKPKFVASVKVSFDDTRGHVRTKPISGVKPPELIYYFLNNGTKVRHAIMTDDFQPKTRIRVIGSFAGQGGLLRVDPRYDGPGIQARKWDEAIATKHRARVAFRLRVALRKAVRASGHQYT